jgi:N-acetylneuraminic acid mutarotase
VAVLGDVLYVMGGRNYKTTEYKMAERYDPKTNRWSPIADMTEKRYGASATALNGNMNIMNQESIRQSA